MKKFAIVLAAFVSLGLAVPAFAEEKKDTMPAVHHHHHHHHHHIMKPEPKPQ
jgi:LAS superfamily LD-carboxypeptidase LdcB